MADMVRVLFVCTANICRSPTLEGVFNDLVQRTGLAARISADSAGINAWWDGQGPDSRTQEAARRRGLDLSEQRARKVEAVDFVTFDYILGVEHSHTEVLRRRCPAKHAHKIRNFMELIPDQGWDEMPDPYSGGPRGFELVLDLSTVGSERLLDEIRKKLG